MLSENTDTNPLNTRADRSKRMLSQMDQLLPRPGVNSNRMSFSSFLEFLKEKTEESKDGSWYDPFDSSLLFRIGHSMRKNDTCELKRCGNVIWNTKVVWGPLQIQSETQEINHVIDSDFTFYWVTPKRIQNITNHLFSGRKG